MEVEVREFENGKVTYKSDYIEVKEIEKDGKRFRLVERTAGRGKMARKLPSLIEVFEKGKWKRIGEV
jgi:hypothetical protein